MTRQLIKKAMQLSGIIKLHIRHFNILLYNDLTTLI
jgi:hypothetical protein